MQNRRFAQTHVIEADVVESASTPRSAFANRALELRETLKAAVTFIFGAVVSLLLLIGVLVAIFGNLKTYLDTTSQLMKLFIQWIIPACIAAVIIYCAYRAFETFAKFSHVWADIGEKRANTKLTLAEAERIRAEAERLRVAFDMDDQGNKIMRDPVSGRFQLYSGNMREHPALSSLHYSIKNDGKDQPLLPVANASKPKIEELVKLVERNSFQLPLGTSLKGNGPVIPSFEDSHIRIIGSSRKGKSCLAAAIIDVATQTHDPDVLTVALLDLENKTSRLFEDMEHLAVLNTGRKEIELHARNPVQAAEYVHLIRNEMDRRYSLPESEQEKQPHILVYIEEFLDLKRHRDLSKNLQAQLLDDLNSLAIRGLKAFIHLMACAQVEYADEDLRAFNNNFGMNVSFAVRPEAARAAGFMCSELLSANWAAKIPGQCVVEATGCTDLVDAPDYDVKALLKARNEQSETASQKPLKRFENGRVIVTQENGFQPDLNQFGKQFDPASQAVLAELEGDEWVIEHFDWKLNQMIALLHETQDEQFRRIWEVSPGPGREYKKAKAERVILVRHMQSMYRKEA